jgi:DNA-binding response OmpR family regulator
LNAASEEGECVAAKIGILNTTQEMIDMLTEILQENDYCVVGEAFLVDIRHGNLHIEDFIKEYSPDILLVDIVPPYIENWHVVQRELRSPLASAMPVVITTTSQRALETVVHNKQVVDLISKPFDLQHLIRAIDRGLDLRV